MKRQLGDMGGTDCGKKNYVNIVLTFEIFKTQLQYVFWGLLERFFVLISQEMKRKTLMLLLHACLLKPIIYIGSRA